ncbi:MAG TPA: hypothetical protein VFG69_13165, partial [Nannocystaceae bacterium]|nr:hypothetical protein [Nannocystaceae bacterium]
KSELAMFFADHEGCAQTLCTCIERYGGEPHATGDLQSAWTHGRDALAKAEDADAVMSALEHLEATVHEAYERARDELRSMGDAPLAAALDAALVEEDEHREWLSHAGDAKPA